MTAIRERRTRSTVVSLVAAIAALLAIAALGVVGMRTLADSTAGQDVGRDDADVLSQRLPFTSTALVGVLDEDDRLTTSAVLVLEPDAIGGSIVGLGASADAGSGATSELAPLASVLAIEGPTGYLEAAERLTGLSFDVVELVDQRRFAQLVAPFGDLPADFPSPVVDASTEESWDAGSNQLTGPEAARAITATDPSVPDWTYEPARAAVWQAIADRVGAGIGSVPAVASDVDLEVPATLDQFMVRLVAGRVGFRGLTFVELDAGRVAEQLPADLTGAFGPSAVDAVVAHDRAELLMVMGAIAPSRLGAPLEAPNFRIVSGYLDADLEPLGVNRADALKQAIDRLLFVQVNVVSVADLADGGVPDVTQVMVADASIVDGIEEVYGDLFAGVEVSVADVAIDGVDVEVRLGRSFLEELRGDPDADVAGSGS